MKQSTLSKWLKIIAIIVGLMGAIMFFVIAPLVGEDITLGNNDKKYLLLPCLIYIWVMAIPCYIALWRFWCIACEIGHDNSFSLVNIKSLNIIGKMAIFDVIVLFTGSCALFLMHSMRPTVLISALFICIGGISVSIICAALAHLVQKAIDIKIENDLTI